MKRVLAVLLLAACPGPQPSDVKLDPPPEGKGFQLKIEPFEVADGQESQRCYFFTVPSDVPVFVSSFHIAQNPGTHHMNVFRVRTVKARMRAAKLPVMDNPSHIVPLLVGDPVLTKKITDALLEQFAIYVQPINYPTVPRGSERLRVTPTPAHSDADIDHLVGALQALWREFGPQGLVVLGFPCDQFGHQEPGDEAEIRDFCSLNYDVTFPMFAKVDVNGDGAHPLWTWLKQEKSGLLGIGAIKWNFSKFLVGRDGKVIKRYAPTDTPESIAGDIGTALA